MRGASVLRKPLPSVFAADLRTALNEAASIADLRECAHQINSDGFLDLSRAERTELFELYEKRFFKLTGALA